MNAPQAPVRVLIAKVGLDGHDRGAKYIAQALRDRGYEVIYTGIRRSVDDVVEAAIQEDVRFLGISMLSGGHNELLPKVVRRLEERGGNDIIVFAGGIIPLADIPFLTSHGVHRVFGPGTTTDDIDTFLRTCLHD